MPARSELLEEWPVDLIPLDATNAERLVGEIESGIAEKMAEHPVGNPTDTGKIPSGSLAAAFDLSPFLRDCALIDPANLVWALSAPIDELLSQAQSECRSAWRNAESEAALMAVLRHWRKRVALLLGLADLAGLRNAAEITASLSVFADGCLASAIDFLLFQFHAGGKISLPDPGEPSRDSGLIVLGMGKFGGRELNYSSDIDIILFYDLDCAIGCNTDDPAALFVRLARQLVKILQERTGDGYVFRVDLRLRPDPGSTPLAIPVSTAFNYYEAYGQNWERAAFIKARPVAGDIDRGARFLQEIAPFIWRKYMDFAAIQDVHSIKRQIHAHRGFGDIAIKGHNVKLGRGGIREIEFFVQTQQLIAGGRRESLRKVRTVEALAALEEDGWIDGKTVRSLESAYWYLRQVEHRIQMVADEQSHTLPEDEAGLDRIAKMMGAKSSKAFATELMGVMRDVESHYAGLFETAPELTGKGGNLVFTGDDDDPQTLETLSGMGFSNPSQIIATIRGWHYGRLPAVRNAQARELLTELTPSLIEAFAEVSKSDQAFFAFDRFVSGLPAGIQFFAILKSNPNLVRLLTLILGSAPRMAEIITRRPHVFDALIDPSMTGAIPEPSELAERLERALSRVSLYEAKLDQARLFAAEQRFLIGIRVLTGTINGRQAGIAFTALAEVMLQSILELVRAEFEKRHGIVAGGSMAILGMGRLGSLDLTAGSDLDLIFLYRHDPDAEMSDGDKPLAAQQYFFRLVQRLIAAMSAPTAEGVLYELDFRLRPSGNSGPLATHLDAFAKYQRNDAWVWERQALVRARPVAGDEALIEQVEDVLSQSIAIPHDPAEVTREVSAMRKTLDAEKPPLNEFDVKRAPGGLVDIEFIAQWLALMQPEKAAQLESRSTLALLKDLSDGFLEETDAAELQAGWTLFNNVLQIQRVCIDGDLETIDSSRGLEHLLTDQLGLPDMQSIRRDLKERQKKVRQIFKRLMS